MFCLFAHLSTNLQPWSTGMGVLTGRISGGCLYHEFGPEFCKQLICCCGIFVNRKPPPPAFSSLNLLFKKNVDLLCHREDLSSVRFWSNRNSIGKRPTEHRCLYQSEQCYSLSGDLDQRTKHSS